MRTIVHLSDLHFGRVDEALLRPLTAQVKKLSPDLVVVSGDLTQRARKEQFQRARQFLDTLPIPQIIVPGNHDIPLHNVFTRFLWPLTKYRRYITSDIEPCYIDEEIAVMGINTARSSTFKEGRVNAEQIARLQARMQPLGAHLVKIIVSHHPFDLPGHYSDKALVKRAPLAMEMFASCGADLLLSGHLHASHSGHTAVRYKIKDYSALMVQAGTATSTRGRGETNSFNVIRVTTARMVIERFGWRPSHGKFSLATTKTFERLENGWAAAPNTAQPTLL